MLVRSFSQTVASDPAATTASSATATAGVSPSFTPDAATFRRRCLTCGKCGGQRIAAWQSGGHLCHRRRSRTRVALEAAQDYSLGDGVNARTDVRWRSWRGVFFLIAKLRECLCGERWPPAAGFVQNEAEPIDVTSYRRAAAGELLRCHVRGRAGNFAIDRCTRGSDGQAEVGDPGTAVTIDHDVRRLQIAMQHARRMRRGKTRGKLPRHIERLLVREVADALQ